MRRSILPLVLLSALAIDPTRVVSTNNTAGSSPTPPSSSSWILETFLELRGVDGDVSDVELRWPCCRSVHATAIAFCDEFVISAVECSQLTAFLSAHEQTASASACKCSRMIMEESPPRWTKLGTLAVHVVHHETQRAQRLKLAVHVGDLEHVHARINTLCSRFQWDRAACGRVRAFVVDQVLHMELAHATGTIAAALSPSSEPAVTTKKTTTLLALETVDTVVAHLLVQRDALRREVKEKAQIIHVSFWQAQKQAHTLERQLRASSRTCTLTAQGLPSNARSQIPRVTSQVSYAEYLAFARNATPVIFTGFDSMEHTPGLPPWTRTTLESLCGEVTVALKRSARPVSGTGSLDGSGGIGNEPSMWAGIQTVAHAPLREFLRDVAAAKESNDLLAGWPTSLADLYLHDMSVSAHCPGLLDLFHVPKFFTRDYLQLQPDHATTTKREHGPSPSQSAPAAASPPVIAPNQRDYWPSLFIGSEATSSALHTDWGSTAAWMGLLHGRKHWVIAKPSARASLLEQMPTLDAPSEGRFQADLMNAQDTIDLREDEVFEGVLEPGEVLFIPADCPHQVKNLGQTIAVAANFVDDANLADHVAFLTRRRDASTAEEYQYYDARLQALDAVVRTSDQRAAASIEEPRALSFRAFKTLNRGIGMRAMTKEQPQTMADE